MMNFIHLNKVSEPFFSYTFDASNISKGRTFDSSFKRDFIIEKQIARHFVKYSECLLALFHFYATQILK